MRMRHFALVLPIVVIATAWASNRSNASDQASNDADVSDVRIIIGADSEKGAPSEAAPEVGESRNDAVATDDWLGPNGADRPYAYIKLESVWRFEAGVEKRLPVCWQTKGYSEGKKIVRDAVTATWQAASGIRFVGWTDCSNEFTGIAIAITEKGPHTKGLGNQLDGKTSGMELNFTFNSWSPSCKDMLEYCIRTIAVHEFGHALGFAHEQNRPDVAGECAELRQGSDGTLLLTPYDPESVMNYCNKEYNNNGKLSAKDTYAVQALYCGPGEPGCIPSALSREW